MIGITLPFNEINDQYLSLPISYIQILFQNKNEWLNPSINDLKNLNKDLTTKNIRSIVHINVKICVINLTGNYLARAIQELHFAKIINAQYIIIHCGTRGKNIPIPKEIFKKNLNNLITYTKIPILLENSASKNCYGSTLEELKDLTKNIQIGGFVYDTMHHYGVENDWQDIWKLLEDPMIKVIHVNNIPHKVNKGSGQDLHESLDCGKMNDFNQLQKINKIKLLETPNRDKWFDELKIIQSKKTELQIQNITGGFKVWIAPVKIGHILIEAAVDSGAEITCISRKTVEKLKRNQISIVYIPNPGVRIKQAAGEIGNTEWIKVPITLSKFTRTIIIPVIRNQYREMLIGLDLLKGQPDRNNGYILNLMKGIMIGNNETIKLQERDKLYLQEILIQNITRDDVLFQIWKRGKYAKNHILYEITRLNEYLNKLDNEQSAVSGVINYLIRGNSDSAKIRRLKEERNLWEDALLELEQKQ